MQPPVVHGMSDPTYLQDHRPVRIATPLGDNVLLLRSMQGIERLGRPFQYELVLLSEKHDVTYKDIIGQNVTVSVDKGDKVPRYFNGFISRFSQTRYERTLVEHRATMVPWLWFLTRSADCRIFQNMTIPDTGALEQVISIPLERDWSFLELAEAIRAAVDQAGYDVTNPTTHLSDPLHETSHDLIIRQKKDGTAIEMISASHDDSEMGSWWKIDETDGKKKDLSADKRDSKAVFEVPSLKDLGGEDGFHGGCPRQRRLLCLGTRADDRLDIYVAPKGCINGRAYAVYGEIQTASGLKPEAPYRNAAYVVYWSTGSTGTVFGKLLDVSPFTLPHEIGHVLADTGHNVAEGDLMHGTWAKDNSATANKRIYGKPLLVGSLDFETEKPKADQDMQHDMHHRNPGILSGWDAP